MEVQDINTNSAAAIFNKVGAVSASAEALGGGFANLLGQLGQNLGTVQKDAAPVENKLQAKPEKDVKTPEAKKDIKKTEKPDAEASQPVKENKAVKEKKKTAEPSAAYAEASEPVQTRPEAQGAPSEAAVPGAVGEGTVVPAENSAEPEAVPGTDLKISLMTTLQPQLLDKMELVIDGETFTLGDLLQAPEKLASLGTLELRNTLKNTVYEVSGSELASALKQISSGDVPESGVELAVQTATAYADFAEPEESAVKIQLPNVASRAEENVLDAGAVKDMPKERIQALEEKFDVKVSVDVKEEKVADSATGLLKGKTALDTQMFSRGEAEVSAKPQTVLQGESVAQAPVQAANKNMPAEGIAAVSLAETANASTMASSASENVSAISSNVSGSGFVAAAKAEAAASKNDVSFKDVYKGLEKEAVEQVKVNITKSAVKGVDKIDIQLKPKELGHIEVKMELSKDGKLQAHIIATRPETMELLQKETEALEQAFREAGLQTEDGFLNFSLRDENQAGARQEENSSLLDFFGQALENEEETLPLASGDVWGGNGLNIRV